MIRLKLITVVITITVIVVFDSVLGYVEPTAGGFTKLGKWSAKGHKGLKDISYYVSLDKATQPEAIKSCRENYNAHLLSPVNKQQFDFVVSKLKGLKLKPGTNFWTSGILNETDWFWLSTKKRINNKTLFWHPKHSSKRGRGLRLWVKGVKTGYCVSNHLQYSARYVCQISL